MTPICRALLDKISNLKSYGKYNHSRPFRPAGSNPPTSDTSMDPFAIVYPHFSAHMHILDDYYVAIVWFAVPATDSCQRCPGWWLLLMVCDSPIKPKCSGTQGGYRRYVHRPQASYIDHVSGVRCVLKILSKLVHLFIIGQIVK